MDQGIIALIIALIGLVSAILGFLSKIPWDIVVGLIFRKGQNIPQIIGTKWEASWYGENDDVYVKDVIELKKWTKKNQFSGLGLMTTDPDGRSVDFLYPIEGEVTPGGLVLLTYRSPNFPTQSLIGTACMQLGASASELSGWWVGPRRVKNPSGESEWKLLPGKLKMRKIS